MVDIGEACWCCSGWCIIKGRGGGIQGHLFNIHICFKETHTKVSFFTELENTNFPQFCASKRKGRSNEYIGKSLYPYIIEKVNFGKNLSSLMNFSIHQQNGMLYNPNAEISKFKFFGGFSGPRRSVKM